MIKKILISSLILNLALLIGRLSGFVRELIVAKTYGVSAAADIVVLWLTLPDLLLNILAGSAIGAALIPGFVANEEKAKVIWFQAILAALIGSLTISVVLQFFSISIVSLLAPGISPVSLDLADYGVKVAIFIFPLSLLVAVNSAYFHYEGKFFMAGIGTLVFNGVLIVGLLLCGYFYIEDLKLILIAVFLAAFVRFFYQFLVVFDRGALIGLFERNYISKEVVVRFLQAMMSSGVIFVYPVIGRSFSSAAGEGGVAIFNYMFKLIELPLMVAVTFLSVVFMPSLAKAWVVDKRDYLSLAIRGIELTLFTAIFVMLPVWIYSDVYVKMVYGAVLDNVSLVVIAESVKLGSLILISQGSIIFLSSVFNSAGSTRVPLFANLFAVALFVMLLKIFGVSRMDYIVRCLVMSQFVGLLIMALLFVRRWFGSFGGIVSCRWFVAILLAPTLIICLDYALQAESELLRTSIIMPVYMAAGMYAALSHPVLKAYLKKVLGKISRGKFRV